MHPQNKSWTCRALIGLSGLTLFANGHCLPDNFYADLTGGLITVGAEILISDLVTDAITPAVE